MYEDCIAFAFILDNFDVKDYIVKIQCREMCVQRLACVMLWSSEISLRSTMLWLLLHVPRENGLYLQFCCQNKGGIVGLYSSYIKQEGLSVKQN